MQRELLSLSGKDDKIAYLKKFQGIGDKYARNMMMDIHDHDFIDSIAIDVGIIAFSEKLKIIISPPPYDKHEKYYTDIAKEVGITPWELDRLLYNNKDHFIKAMK